MFEVLSKSSESTKGRYGYETKDIYEIKTDESLNILDVLGKLQDLGNDVCGECRLASTADGYRLEVTMY